MEAYLKQFLVYEELWAFACVLSIQSNVNQRLQTTSDPSSNLLPVLWTCVSDHKAFVLSEIDSMCVCVSVWENF